LRNTDYRQDVPESSSAPEVPALRYFAFLYPIHGIDVRTNAVNVHYLWDYSYNKIEHSHAFLLLPTYGAAYQRILRSLGLYLQNICSFSSH
jgi:hypothetical protein